MGQVYLALDTNLNRRVALKVLPSDLTGNPLFLRRFQQEARTASALNHPNILTVFEFTEISGRHLIVSEFVEGETLRSVLKRKIELSQALDILSQAASALAAAHAAGVVHRDLKPTNIMIRPDGYVKIIDFGLAKLTQRGGDAGSGHEAWTMPGAVLGTVGYMSPEQARGEEIDARSDIWSLGVILYEMVARSRPFEGSTDSHVIVAILDEAPRPIPGELPNGLTDIINRALGKEKKWRYPSANELLADVQRLQVSIGAPTWRPKLPTARWAFPYGPVAAGLVVLAAAFAVWWWPFEGRWRILGPQWFEIGASRRITFQGNVLLATISPSGKYLAYTVGSGGSQIFRLLNLQTNAERQLPSTGDDYRGLTFSPDSKTLFYVLKDIKQERGRLFSVSTAGIGLEPPSVVIEDLDGPITLSPTGDRFAFVRGRAERNQDVNQILVGLESNPRNISPIVSLNGTEIHDRLAWSPGNNWLAAITYPTQLRGATRATVSLFGLDSHRSKSFSPVAFRQLWHPVALDGGSLLVFAGMPEGGEQNRLVQLFVPTGVFHQSGSSMLGFESLSSTSDSQTIAAVQFDERSSIWVADSQELQSAQKLTPDSEKVSSLDWLEDGSIVYPSARTGDVNLVRLQPNGKVTPLSNRQYCVQNEPASVPGSETVVYSSNCAYRDDDFNLWAVDASNGKLRSLTSGFNFDNEPCLSPDGKWVYYTSWPSNIPSVWKVPVQGGVPVRVLQAQAQTPIVSPDGTKLVSAVREDHGNWSVAVVSTADGSIMERLPQVPLRRPIRWSPDGLALDYVNEDKISSGIWRQPLPSGVPALLLRVSEGTIPSFKWNRSGTKLAYIRARDQKDAVLFTRAVKD